MCGPASALPGSHDGYAPGLGEFGEKIVHGPLVGAERGRELAGTARKRVAG